jgi:hypothetical protein
MEKHRVIIRALLAAALAFAPSLSYAAYTGTPPLLVVDGGTGAQTFTAHGILVGEGTGAVVALSPVADSVVVWGSASSDPTTAGTSSTADSVLGWGAAASTPAPETLTSCSGATSAVTYNTSTHAFGCNTLSTGGVALTTATAAGTSPITITATNGLTTIVSMGTPAASVINLPTAVQTAGWRECVKDGTTNFATNNATVKSPTSGTIDGVAGATGVVMNQAHQELCFISDATNWWIE